MASTHGNHTSARGDRSSGWALFLAILIARLAGVYPPPDKTAQHVE